MTLTTKLEIEEGIPLPKKRKEREGRLLKEIFDELKVGDSFKSPHQAYVTYASRYKAYRRAKDPKDNWNYTSKTLVSNGETYYRIWRTA